MIAAVAAEPGVDAFALRLESNSNQFVITGPGGTGLMSPQAYQSITGSMGPFIEQGQTVRRRTTSYWARRSPVDRRRRRRLGHGRHRRQGDQEYTVSGIGRLSDGDETDLAFFTTPDGLTRLGGSGLHQRERRVRSTRRHRRRGSRAARRPRVRAGDSPSRVANLSQIGSVPKLLAIALAMLGIGGATHGLLVASTRRRADIAVARALGFTPRQAASSVRWQGVVITAFAVVVGVRSG